MCIAEGFPALPWLVDSDLSRPDGAIHCRQLTVEELVQLGWRVGRAIKILTRLPILV